MGTVIHIWAQRNFKQASVMSLRGKAELTPGMDIVRKLDIAVRSGSDQPKAGHGEWEMMMTFNENHRLGISCSANCLRLR